MVCSAQHSRAMHCDAAHVGKGITNEREAARSECKDAVIRPHLKPSERYKFFLRNRPRASASMTSHPYNKVARTRHNATHTEANSKTNVRASLIGL